MYIEDGRNVERVLEEIVLRDDYTVDWHHASPWELVWNENSNITLNRIGLKPNHIGEANFTLDEFIPVIEKYHNQDYQIAIHVQGEIAIDIALDAIDYALQKKFRKNLPYIFHLS